MIEKQTCIWGDCGRTEHRLGLCVRHYGQFRRSLLKLETPEEQASYRAFLVAAGRLREDRQGMRQDSKRNEYRALLEEWQASRTATEIKPQNGFVLSPTRAA